MNTSIEKEQFSRAYIGAIASRLGINSAKPDVDDDSVDLTLIGKGYENHFFQNPNIDIQLKCTANGNIHEGVLRFSLKKKNYNDLRIINCCHPRYLFILLVPRNIDEWLTLDSDHMILRNMCYYISLKGYPVSENRNTVSIAIPIENRITCSTMMQIMEKAADGESL
jgi:hypothetical protein